MRRLPARGFRSNLNHRLFARLAELDAVANEVLEELGHLPAISEDHRQRADVHLAARVLNAHFEIGDYGACYVAQIHRGERLGIAGYAREAEQILNQDLHASRRILHAG